MEELSQLQVDLGGGEMGHSEYRGAVCCGMGCRMAGG